MKKRKLWLLPLSTTLAIAPVALAARCNPGNSDDPDKKNKVYKNSQEFFEDQLKDLREKPDNASNMPNTAATQQKWRTFLNGEYSETAYREDPTTSYGSLQNRVEENVAGMLIRKQNIFSPIVEKISEIGKATYKIKRPSVWKYRLELASQVIITKMDGTEEVFDNDKVNKFPDFSNTKEQTFDEIQYQAFYKEDASDPDSLKSINGEHFFNTLKVASKIRFAIKENLKWTAADGTQTNYDIKAKDFYISMWRKYFLDESTREKYINKLGDPKFNVKQMDLDIRGLLPTTESQFGSRSSYPNAYVYKLYGFDMGQFLDENRFLTDYKGKKAVTLEVLKPHADNLNTGYLFDNIASTYDFSAAPSEYIADHAANPLFRSFDVTKNAQPFLDLIKQIDPSNEISKAGVYWYGANSEFVLYAGAYRYKGYDTTSSNDEYVLNSHYWDQKFVLSDNTVKTYVKTYKNKMNETQFSNKWFNDYKSGDASDLSFASLDKTQRDEIAADPSKYNVSYNKNLNLVSLKRDLEWMLIPAKINAAIPKFYNENYAHLVYGSPGSDVVAGTVKGETAYENMLAGKGLSFRTIIDAAINWSFVADFSSNGQNKSYLGALAQDGLVNGSDSKTTKNKVIDYYDDLNKLLAVDKDLNRVDFGSGNNYISAQDNVDYLGTASSDEEKAKSAKYQILQDEMTKLLDDFYTTNGLAATEKIEWQTFYRWSNWAPPKMKNVFQFVQKLVNGLDKKGRLNVTYDKFDSSTKQWYFRFMGHGPYVFSGWGYDYPAIGSGLDGIGASDGGLGVSMILIGTIPNLQTKLAPAFPKLVQASKDFVKYINDNIGKGDNFKLGVPLNKWKEVETEKLFNFRTDLMSYVWNTTTNQVDDAPVGSDFTDFALMSARFFFNYNYKMNKTNQELIDLASEMANYAGFSVDRDLQIANDAFTRSINNSNYSVPYAGTNGSWLADTIVYK